MPLGGVETRVHVHAGAHALSNYSFVIYTVACRPTTVYHELVLVVILISQVRTERLLPITGSHSWEKQTGSFYSIYPGGHEGRDSEKQKSWSRHRGEGTEWRADRERKGLEGRPGPLSPLRWRHAWQASLLKPSYKNK